MKKTKFLSQNLDFQKYTFEGNAAFYRKILNNDNIYEGNNLVYTGQINLNLFPHVYSRR